MGILPMILRAVSALKTHGQDARAICGMGILPMNHGQDARVTSGRYGNCRPVELIDKAA
jgi:hypothetical protein